ncbi:MAG: hypothetical protein IKM97_03065 [Clostridia bacterium]|nr:hypothetical protein [Clostridia bacterium]
MLESNNENNKSKSYAKSTFIGLLFFSIICISITYVCIYITMENKKQLESNEDNQVIEKVQVIEDVAKKVTNNHKTLKLTDKSYLNGITEIKEEENYGEIVDYTSYITNENEPIYKLEIEYIQIAGLKDKNVQATINKAIKDKIDELKEKCILRLDDENIDRISINCFIRDSFADVISIYINDFIIYKNNDINNYDSQDYGLNFSLSTGEKIKFNDLFWDDSSIKTILSQSAYKELAWYYALSNENLYEYWDMDKIDYSEIESKVYNFMYKYNKNPDINFYFTTSTIIIPYNRDRSIIIEMADYYEDIALYTRFKADNLYEEDSNLKEFYVFSRNVLLDYYKENGKKADNVYYTVYSYDYVR